MVAVGASAIHSCHDMSKVSGNLTNERLNIILTTNRRRGKFQSNQSERKVLNLTNEKEEQCDIQPMRR
jgi:hypothetical protein